MRVIPGGRKWGREWGMGERKLGGGGRRRRRRRKRTEREEGKREKERKARKGKERKGDGEREETSKKGSEEEIARTGSEIRERDGEGEIPKYESARTRFRNTRLRDCENARKQANGRTDDRDERTTAVQARRVSCAQFLSSTPRHPEGAQAHTHTPADRKTLNSKLAAARRPRNPSMVQTRFRRSITSPCSFPPLLPPRPLPHPPAPRRPRPPNDQTAWRSTS